MNKSFKNKKKNWLVQRLWQKISLLQLLIVLIHLQRSNRSSRWRCSVKEGVLGNFAKFTGKHLCQRLFFKKVAGQACNFIKKDSLAQVFSCDFCEISKNTFFTKHIQTTASKVINRKFNTHIIYCYLA